MSETQPEAQSEPQSAPVRNPRQTLFAVYDKTEKRYVTGPHGSKAKAEAAAKAKRQTGHSYETREV